MRNFSHESIISGSELLKDQFGSSVEAKVKGFDGYFGGRINRAW